MAIIDKSSDHFETKLYTGNGGTLNVTGLDFAPNWVWIKSRTSSRVHCLFDTVRGATKRLQSNEADSEYTTSNSLTAFNSDGFSLGSYNQSNEGSANFVSWNWKAGGSASSNSSGNITSSVSANTDAGFSVVTYSGNGSAGSTVGHGLGSAANLLIVKKTSSSGQWVVGSTGLDSSWDNFLFLDATSAKGNADNVFNDTAPTSSVFSIGNAGDTNASGQTYVAYCFAEKNGFSKFGTYTGNGSTDGPFSYTGFKPAFIIYKGSSGSGAADNWEQHDNKRDPNNPMESTIYPNLSNAESDPASTTDRLDMLSNGFKMKTSSGDYNNSGTEYFYIAFAENPFVTSTGNGSIPGTAK